MEVSASNAWYGLLDSGLMNMDIIQKDAAEKKFNINLKPSVLCTTIIFLTIIDSSDAAPYTFTYPSTHPWTINISLNVHKTSDLFIEELLIYENKFAALHLMILPGNMFYYAVYETRIPPEHPALKDPLWIQKQKHQP